MLALVPAALLAWYFISSRHEAPARILPVFNDKRADSGTAHFVPPFAFTDQHGRTFSERDVRGKIYVAEFFFTTCRTICPVMNMHLEKLYRAFSGEPRLLILSHTVDPETDSVRVLRAYAAMKGVSDDRWRFLTGDKASLYRMARRGYLLGEAGPAPGEEDFVHTQNFALVDWDRRIRGIYDGTDSLEMRRLDQEIKLLLKEHDARRLDR